MTGARPATIDDSVIAALGARAEWAWRRLFEATSAQLTAYARSRAGAGSVDDVVAETYARAFRSFDRFEGDEAGLRAWLYAIARNVAIDLGRAHRSHETFPAEMASAADPAPGAEHDLLDRAAVDALLASLSERQREVIVLRVVDDLSIDQVAYVMGITPGSVKVHQRRAERHLARQVDGTAFDERQAA